MKQELTAKENKFCELITKGYSQVDAYKTAYECKGSNNNTIKNNAYKLMNKQNIINRLAELKEKTEKELKYTKEQQYNELCLLQEQARKDGNLQAELKAIELKGKLFDLYNNKLSIKADIKAKASIDIQKFYNYNIIYTIDESLLKEVIAGNEEDETVKMIIEDLKKTETAIITDKQLNFIVEEEKKVYNTARTIAMDCHLKEVSQKFGGKKETIVFDAEDKNC